jgi:hypothetical protein
MTYTPSNVHDSKDGGINNVDWTERNNNTVLFQMMIDLF